jgi:hypothetical protein
MNTPERSEYTIYCIVITYNVLDISGQLFVEKYTFLHIDIL